MKKLVFVISKVLLFVSILGCSSQEINKEDLLGNWKLLSNSDSNLIDYQEIFIEENKIYYFNEKVGLRPSQSYSIEGNSLIIFDSRFEKEIKLGKIIVSENTFKIKSDKGVIVYEKISGSPNLEQYLSKQVDEDSYWNAFFARMNR